MFFYSWIWKSSKNQVDHFLISLLVPELITHQELVRTKWNFSERGSRRPSATVDVKRLTFWAAYLVLDLFNCKHEPFISTVLANANRLLTYAGHSHGWLGEQSLSIGERGVEGKWKFIQKISPPSKKCMYNLKPQQNIQKYFHAPVKKPDTSRNWNWINCKARPLVWVGISCKKAQDS